MKIPDRFMVVDDDPINNLICKVTLRKFFGEISTLLFTDPSLALQAIYEENNCCDTVLFLDINMPEMTGWDFLEGFSHLDSSTVKCFTIYMLSSSVDPRDKETAEANHLVKGFFSKPLTIAMLNQVFKGDS